MTQHVAISLVPGRLRRFAVIVAVWSSISLFNIISIYLRITSGELRPGPDWLLSCLAVTPLWACLTPPIMCLSRRFPIGRWRTAVPVHMVGWLAVLAIDGVIGLVLSPGVGPTPLTFWQQMWRYSFIDTFFYGGVVAVELAARYYRMYLDRRVQTSELEAQVSRAQLQALQMQIRPHFLFNALNTISGLVRTDNKPAAVTMLAGLGDLLRLLLRSDGAQEVPVRQELELIERYLEIEQVRFGNKLRFEIHIDAGVDNALVPYLILQPLVENAVRHGIGASNASGAGRVSIAVEHAGSRLRMTVSDSGDAGPDPARALAERETCLGSGIGLSNTRARLERMYGSQHRFELAHHAAGTSAILEIPLHRKAMTS
jgi:two-component sensor histidine kinase